MKFIRVDDMDVGAGVYKAVEKAIDKRTRFVARGQVFYRIQEPTDRSREHNVAIKESVEEQLKEDNDVRRL